jgi:peptidyl-prolyl cis-trans isomerase D
MLQFIRSKAGSFVVKLLFAALIACFGFWGIGDFLRQTPTGNTVLTVGGTKVPADQVRQAIERESDSMKQMFGGSLSHDQLKQLGIVDRAVQGLADRAAFDEEAKRLHLVAGDDEIAVSIAQDPAFRGPNGQFSRDTFQQLLAANQINEQQYVEMIRAGIPRQDLAQVALSNARAPQALADMLYARRQERRVADYIFVPADKATPVPTPTDADLQAYYKQNPTRFTAPEYRGFTALALGEADVDASLDIPDSKLQDLYQQHQDEFSIAEQRDVLNLTLPDEATAKKAEAALTSGRDFMAVAKQIGNQTADTVDLGWIQHKDLPDALSAIAFSAKQGAVSQPVKTDFGWSILRVAGIKPAHVLSFQQARPQLLAEAKRDAAGDALYALSNKVEDALAGGADLHGIAQQFNLKPFSVKAVDQQGNGPDGKPIAGLPVGTADLVKAVFQTNTSQLSPLGQTKDGKFFITRTDGVIQPALKPFAAVHDQVVAAWTADRRAASVTALAGALQKQAAGGTTLAALAKTYGASVVTTPPFTHDADQAATSLPSGLTGDLFGLKPGGITASEGQNAGTDGVFVAKLDSAQPGDAKADTAAVTQMRQEISSEVGNEMVSEFSQALRRRYPVQVNQPLLDQLY